MARRAKEKDGAKKAEVEQKQPYKDYDAFTEEVAAAVKDNRVIKLRGVWRVYEK